MASNRVLAKSINMPFLQSIRGVKRNAINRVVRKNDNDFDN